MNFVLYYSAAEKKLRNSEHNAFLHSFASVLKTSLRKRAASVFVAMAAVRERRVAMDGHEDTLEEFVDRYGWLDGERFWAATGATQLAALDAVWSLNLSGRWRTEIRCQLFVRGGASPVQERTLTHTSSGIADLVPSATHSSKEALVSLIRADRLYESSSAKGTVPYRSGCVSPPEPGTE